MKNLFSKMMFMAFAAMTFTACEDVPEPYDKPGTGSNTLGSETIEGAYINETFSTSFGSFTNITVKGQGWVIDYKTAKATGYADGQTTESEAYLVSQPVDLSASEKAYLEFEYILRYVRAGSTQNKVLVTANYSGDPTTTAWTDITGTLTEGSDWSTFYKYQMNLPDEFIAQQAVVVALYYSCTTTSATIEVKNLKLMEGEAEGGNDTENSGEGTIGTAENPITVAEAIAIINALGNKEKSALKAYVKGKVVKVTTSQTNFEKYGNLNYYISDDGNDTNTIQVYAGDGLNGEKFNSISDISAGDEVVVVGTLYKYVNSSGTVIPEIEGSHIVSLTEGATEPTPATADNNLPEGRYFFVYTVGGDVQVGKPVETGNDYGYMYLTNASVSNGTLDADEAHLFTFTATDGGYTLQDASGRYYYMDATHNSFQVSAAMPASNFVWTANISDNGEATVTNAATGKTIQYYAKYNELCPTTNGDGLPRLLKPGDPVDGGSDDNPGGGEVSGNTITADFTAMGLGNAEDITTLTLSDGTTLTFSAGENKNGPKYYNSGTAIRMYPTNNVTITSGSGKNISTVTITCSANNAEGMVEATPGTVTVNDMTVSISDLGVPELTVTNTHTGTGTLSQLRVSKMVINYAE